MTVPSPGMAPAPQHLQALERANRTRLARAALKHRVARGELAAAAVVLEVPWEAEGLAIVELLMSQRGWGRDRAVRFLAGVAIWERKSLGALTVRQRRLIARELGPGCP